MTWTCVTASVFLTKAYLYSAAQFMLCRSAACMHAAEMHPETLKQVSIRSECHHGCPIRCSVCYCYMFNTVAGYRQALVMSTEWRSSRMF